MDIATASSSAGIVSIIACVERHVVDLDISYARQGDFRSS